VFNGSLDPEAIKRRVRALVARMVEIAPESSHTNAWLGWIAYRWDGDPQAAADYFERAIADNPMRPASILRGVTGYLSYIGREKEAYAIARYAVARDPANERWIAMVARRARELQRVDDAIRYIEDVAEWRPLSDTMRWHLGVLYLTSGQPGDALEQFDLIIASGENPRQGKLGRVLALYDLGRTADFEKEFAALREIVLPEGTETLARIYAWTGDNDRAFEYLDRTIERWGPGAVALATTDLYARLGEDPRYEAFMHKYGWGEEDLSHIRFDPPFPPAMQAEIDRIVDSLKDQPAG
jgi:tetratricopeptide (TPR) repeat protein